MTSHASACATSAGSRPSIKPGRPIVSGAKRCGITRRPAPVITRSNISDDVPSTTSPSTCCPPEVRHRLEGAFADAVARASHDPFVPYENATGIVNLAECSTSNGGGMGAGAGGGWDDPPEGTVDEVVIATVRELEGLFGQGGVEATAFNPTDGGLGPGFVRLSLSQFQDDPHSWASEAELWESMVETYGVLLVPGALVEPAETSPGTFLACCAGRSEEALLTGMDRLRTQLLQRKFLHGRW